MLDLLDTETDPADLVWSDDVLVPDDHRPVELDDEYRRDES